MGNESSIAANLSGKSAPAIVIAGYLDILGFKALIDLSERDWAAAIAKVKLIDEKLKQNFKWGQDENVVRFFSDNVYVSAPLVDDEGIKADNLFWFFRYLYEIQWFFVEVGIFLRGGIAVGTEYVTETALFGTALVKAYLAEKNCAKVPRVVVHNSFLEALDKFENQMTGYGASNTRLLISKDPDGTWFVDYMSLWDDWSWTESFRRKIFRKHREQILKQVKSTSDHEILRKYLWLARYHNKYGEQYGCRINLKKWFGPVLS